MSQVRALTMLNQTGDTTIIWTEEEDEKWEAIIRHMMEVEKVTFFIIEPRCMGLLPPKKTELRDVKDARKHRSLAMPTEAFQKLVEAGSGHAIKTPQASVKTRRKCTDPKEVAQSEAVGIRPMRGG